MGDPAQGGVHLSPVELPYVEQGDPSGVPVVLLHAYVDSLRSFEQVLPHLPPSLHVYVPSQRGHGDGPVPESGYALTDFSEDVGAFMDAVGVETALLVGSSSGGYVAQRFALDHPTRVSGLVLVGCPRSLNERPAILDTVAGLSDPVDPVFVREFVASTVADTVPADFLDMLVAESCKVPARVWKATLEGLIEAEPPTETGTITAPTTIIWGDGDAYVPLSEQQALAAAIPGSKLVVCEDAGHVVHWERPARVAAEISALAASSSGGSARSASPPG